MRKGSVTQGLIERFRIALVINTNLEVKAWQGFQSDWPTNWRDITYVWHEAAQVFQGYGVATVLIEDRYVLKGILDLEVSADYQSVRFPRLRFHLYEVKEVRPPADKGAAGGFSISYNSASERWFGLKEWEQLKRSKWDFSTIGVTLVSNSPVSNIRSVLHNL